MADTLQQNDLSNGAFNTPQTQLPGPSITPQGGRPADVIGRAQQMNSSVGFLQYPLDLPKYYMGFTIYEYARQNLLEIALRKQLNQIAMPFPEQMLDMNAVAFDHAAFSGTIGNIVNTGFDVVNKVRDRVAAGDNSGTLNQFNESIKESKLDGVTGGVVADAIGAGGEQAKAFAGAAGYSPNYFLTVVLNGPQYKKYTLSWTCAPRNPKEAAQLTQVIRVFKDGMAPGLALGGALFTFPRVFQNYFAPDRGHLYQFKPSVLSGFQVNYSPGGFPSMKQTAGELNNWHAPSAIKITAQFQELEFWLRGDYGNAAPGADPNQDFSNQIHPTPGDRFA